MTNKELLAGVIPPPEEAKVLYDALMLREHRLSTDFDASDAPADGTASAPGTGAAATAGGASGKSLRTPQPPASQSAGASRPPAGAVVATKPSAAASGAAGSNVQRAKAMYDFQAQQPGDLAFMAGDVIEILEKTGSTNDWWKGSVKGKTGSFPANYVQLL